MCSPWPVRSIEHLDHSTAPTGPRAKCEGRQTRSLETCVTWGQGGLLHALCSESDMVRFTLERDLTDCCVDGEFKSGPGLRHRNWVSALTA